MCVCVGAWLYVIVYVCVNVCEREGGVRRKEIDFRYTGSSELRQTRTVPLTVARLHYFSPVCSRTELVSVSLVL